MNSDFQQVCIKTGGDGSNKTGGDGSNDTGGDGSNDTGGDGSNDTGGDGSNFPPPEYIDNDEFNPNVFCQIVPIKH